MRPEDTEMIANICSFERIEAANHQFQPFKAPGPDRGHRNNKASRRGAQAWFVTSLPVVRLIVLLICAVVLIANKSAKSRGLALVCKAQ